MSSETSSRRAARANPSHRTGRLGMNIWAHVGFNATTVAILLSQG